tara:strand:+ start:1025 stop:1729 length:705 start_codon:yes stop_codon:yes gene_type:complete
MINVNELYKAVQFFSNKEQSGFIKPSEFNLLADRAQMEMFMKKFGNPEMVGGPMQPFPKYSYQETQKISDDLRIFVKKLDTALSSGFLGYPNDYVHFSSCRVVTVSQGAGMTFKKKEVEVSVVDDSELGYILNSAIVSPEPDYPVACFYEQGIQFYPEESNRVVLTYLRRPAKPLWAFTTVNGRPVHDESNSVNLEFPEETLNEILVKILSYIGINLREPQLIQYSETQKNAGI